MTEDNVRPPIDDNREQVDKVISQYVKRNTPRKGEFKDVLPTQGDLLNFTSELLFRVGLETSILLTEIEGQNIAYEDVLLGITDGAMRLFFERLDEMRERGIQIEVLDEEAEENDDTDGDIGEEE